MPIELICTGEYKWWRSVVDLIEDRVVIDWSSFFEGFDDDSEQLDFDEEDLEEDFPEVSS